MCGVNPIEPKGMWDKPYRTNKGVCGINPMDPIKGYEG